MHTPKQRTERLLAQTLVCATYEATACDAVFFALMQQYAPDVRIDLYWQQDFANPVASFDFDWVPLREALERVTARCWVELAVNDYGSVVLRQPLHQEAMKHAVVVELPPIRAMMPSANLEKELARASGA